MKYLEIFHQMTVRLLKPTLINLVVRILQVKLALITLESHGFEVMDSLQLLLIAQIIMDLINIPKS